MARLDGELLRSPVEIAPNLQAGVRLGRGWLTIGYSHRPGCDGRTRYRWEVIFNDGTDSSGDDMQSGCQGGDLMNGLESMLSFLSAAVESRQYRERTGRQGENEDLFPADVIDFADQYDVELSVLTYELTETLRTWSIPPA